MDMILRLQLTDKVTEIYIFLPPLLFTEFFIFFLVGGRERIATVGRTETENSDSKSNVEESRNSAIGRGNECSGL